jgi:hypothetical protein
LQEQYRLFRICGLTLRYRGEIDREQRLGLAQYLEMLNSYDKLADAATGMTELATAHCLETVRDLGMSPLVRWLMRLRERRLERWFR